MTDELIFMTDSTSLHPVSIVYIRVPSLVLYILRVSINDTITVS